jgi:hypothetical protein
MMLIPLLQIIRWSDYGDEMIIADPERLEREVLGREFKQGSVASFTRE